MRRSVFTAAIIFATCSLGWAEETRPATGGTIVLEQCLIRAVDKAMISAERDGIVETMAVAIGDQVEKGQRLVLLRDEIAKANLALAEAQAADDTEVRFSELLKQATLEDFDRITRLEKTKSATARDLTRATLEKGRGQFSTESALVKQNIRKLEAELAAAQLQAFHVDAPFEGVVTRLLKTTGEAVNDGEPLMELVNTSRLQIEGFAPVAQVWKLQRGAPVTVELTLPELASSGIETPPCEGKIVLVDVVVQPVTQTVRVVAEVENRENTLRDGLRARMTIDASRAAEAKTAATAP